MSFVRRASLLMHQPQDKAGVDALISALSALEPSHKLHILVNNSGVAWGAPLDNVPEQKGWDNVMAVNVKSVFYCVSHPPDLSILQICLHVPDLMRSNSRVSLADRIYPHNIVEPIQKKTITVAHKRLNRAGSRPRDQHLVRGRVLTTRRKRRECQRKRDI